MKIKHNSTGNIFEVVSSNSKTLFLKAIEVNTPVFGLKVGDKQKTNAAAVGVLYTVIAD